MKKKNFIIPGLILSVFSNLISCDQNNESKFAELKGPYLGQKPPGKIPELFAPGIISTGFHEHSIPAFSPDGKKLYFTANEPGSENQKSMDLWYVKNSAQGWSKPVNIGAPVNTDKIENQVSVTIDHTLYYVGFFSGGDLYISFRKKNNNWTEPKNLGPQINERFNERFPFVSPDGKYLFYLSDKLDHELETGKYFSYDEILDLHSRPGNGYCDIYWVDAGIIEKLRPENLD